MDAIQLNVVLPELSGLTFGLLAFTIMTANLLFITITVNKSVRLYYSIKGHYHFNNNLFEN
jgi:hypothetical protein